MSFDLSQLDRLAKGEWGANDAQDALSERRRNAAPRPRVRPQGTRRKGRMREEEEVKDGSDVATSKDTSLHSERASAVVTLQRDSLPVPQPPSPPKDGLELSPVGVAGRKRKGRRERRHADEESLIAKKSAKQDRLERLVNVKDVSELPLCDLILRASYLEEQTLLQETQNQKSTPPPADDTPEPSPPSPPVQSILAPQVTVVDGRLVVNQESLERTNQHSPSSLDHYVRVEEGEDRLVNYHSYADWSTSRGVKWSKEETELLVQGIGQFGIDFSLLQRLFPGRDRKQIKAKFSRMWKEDPHVFGLYFDKSAEKESEGSYNKFIEGLKAERSPSETDAAVLPLSGSDSIQNDLSLM